jgi:transcriptional regulator with XRE-family HTH domain
MRLCNHYANPVFFTAKLPAMIGDKCKCLSGPAPNFDGLRVKGRSENECAQIFGIVTVRCLLTPFKFASRGMQSCAIRALDWRFSLANSRHEVGKAGHARRAYGEAIAPKRMAHGSFTNAKTGQTVPALPEHPNGHGAQPDKMDLAWKTTATMKPAASNMKVVNLIGRQISRLRYERGWTQEELANKLSSIGWEIDRSRLSKIEGGTLYVPDFRLFYFAEALGVEVPALFPKIDHGRPVHQTILKFIRNEHRGLVPETAPAAGPIAAVLLTKGRR